MGCQESAASPAQSEITSSLIAFTGHTYARYQAEPVHRLIAEKMDGVVRGEIERLMIFAPPQHGKSELVSVRLPAFWLGHHPDLPVAIASYGATLAESKSRQVRDIVESDAYRALFAGVGTRRDSRAVDYWQLAAPHRGGVWAGGVGGPITGHGFALGIIDDPFENWEQAQSQTIRDKVWEWWRGTFRTRIWEGGRVVLIMTRWHMDDLAGRLLGEQGDRWHVLRLPAVAETQAERDKAARHVRQPMGAADPLEREPGAPLAPLRFSSQALADLRRDVGSLVWAAEYQGVPAAAEGNRIKRAWFQTVEAAPVQAQMRVRYWDKAASADGKRTAGVRLALGRDGLWYIEHVVAGKWTTHERRQVMHTTAQTDGQGVYVWIEQEPGSSGVDSVQDEIRLLAGFSVRPDTPSGDKDTRLEPFVAQLEAGNVRLVRGAWNEGYIDEMTAIPNGAYRDQADASAGAFNRIASQPGGVGLMF